MLYASVCCRNKLCIHLWWFEFRCRILHLCFCSYSRVALATWKLAQRICLTNLTPKQNHGLANISLSILLFFISKQNLIALTNKGDLVIPWAEGLEGKPRCRRQHRTLRASAAPYDWWLWHWRVLCCCCFIFHTKHKREDRGHEHL